MRKLIFILVLALSFSYEGYGQFPISSTLGSPSTQVYSRGGLGADSAFVARTNFADTTAANRGFLDGIPGAIIRAGGSLWLRNQAATAWEQVGSNANIYTANGTLSGNRTVNGGSFSLTWQTFSRFEIMQDIYINGARAGKGGGDNDLSTVFGEGALATPSGRGNNTAMGYQALAGGVGSEDNVAVGTLAMAEGGTNNVAIGSSAMASAANSTSTIAIGSLAMNNTSGVDNSVAIGYATLQASSGDGNIAIGSLSMTVATTGFYNTAVGFQAMRETTTGEQNAAFGTNALYFLTEGIKNSAFGAGSLEAVTTGGFNVGVGQDAGLDITTGGGNIAIGWNSIRDVVTTSYNTAVGYASGATVTGGYNTFIGASAGFNASQYIPAINSMALGYNAYTLADNQVVLGNTEIQSTLLRGYVGVETDAPIAQFSVKDKLVIYDSAAGGITSTIDAKGVNQILNIRGGTGDAYVRIDPSSSGSSPNIRFIQDPVNYVLMRFVNSGATDQADIGVNAAEVYSEALNSGIPGFANSMYSLNRTNFLKLTPDSINISRQPASGSSSDSVLVVENNGDSYTIRFRAQSDISGGGGGGTPASPNTGVQVNINGAFDASDSLTYDAGQLQIGLGDVSGTPTPSRVYALLNSATASGSVLNGLFKSTQTAATTGSIQGVEGYIELSHTTGTVALAIGTIGNIEQSAGGVVTDMRGVQGGVVITGIGGTTYAATLYSAGVTIPSVEAIIGNAYGLFMAAHTTGIGTITNAYGTYFQVPTGNIGNRLVGYYSEDVGTDDSAYAYWSRGGKVRFESLATASTDTTTYKPLGIDADGILQPMSSWPGGGVTGSGSSGRVAFWSSASAITSNADFLWDGNRLTVTNSGGIGADGLLILNDNVGSNSFKLGFTTASNNSADFFFNYVGSGSASNSLNLSLAGAAAFNITIQGNGNTGVRKTSPVSYLDVGGSFGAAITTLTTTTTLDGTHYTVLVDASGGAVTINLPAVAGITGRIYNVKKIDASGNAVTIDGNGGELIDGVTTQTISAQWASYTIQTNGSAWYIK